MLCGNGGDVHCQFSRGLPLCSRLGYCAPAKGRIPTKAGHHLTANPINLHLWFTIYINLHQLTSRYQAPNSCDVIMVWIGQISQHNQKGWKSRIWNGAWNENIHLLIFFAGIASTLKDYLCALIRVGFACLNSVYSARHCYTASLIQTTRDWQQWP